MLLDFDYLVKKYKLDIKGVLHIGAHQMNELDIYQKNNIKNIIGFEPVPSTFKILEENIRKYPEINITLVNKALGNSSGKIKMYTEQANQGQSNSILKPKIHVNQYPHIVFNGQVEIDIMKLDNYNDISLTNYNLINIDVQGYELEVFKGAIETLNNIDYIICEVNRAEIYEGCPMVEELDEFLKIFNFIRVETSWDGVNWGDAFYIKS